MEAGKFEERLVGSTLCWVLNEVLIVHTHGDSANLKTLRAVSFAAAEEKAEVAAEHSDPEVS